MTRKSVIMFVLAMMLTATLLVPVVSSGSPTVLSTSSKGSVMDLVDKDRLHGYAEDIVTISENYPAFRVAGSEGSNMTAEYIFGRFAQFGLDTWTEEFNFTNWDLHDHSLTVDADGNWSTDSDRVGIASFSADSYSVPSNRSHPVAEMVYLPLPAANSSYDVQMLRALPYKFWNNYDLTGKVVIVPREARWNGFMESSLIDKMYRERPLAVVVAYWYDWNSALPDMTMSSTGGRPLSGYGDYYWDLNLPCGFVNYSDGVRLRDMVDAGTALADLRINSTIYQGTQANVVAKIEGTENPEKQLLITAHYDSVMGPGYIDNAAGVAGVIEAAYVMKRAYDEGIWKPDITVMFIAFAGEELGYAGSAFYVTSHDINDIVSVINLDSIGGLKMHVSRPGEGAKIGIERMFEEVADDEDVPFSIISSLASDHRTFIAPGYSTNLIWDSWRVSFTLTTYDSVPNSVMVYSSPLLVSEEEDGQMGLGHTRMDDTDPEGYPYWNAEERLYGQERVIVGVSVMLLSGEYKNDITDPTWQPYVFGVTIIIAIVLVFLVFRRKLRE